MICLENFSLAFRNKVLLDKTNTIFPKGKLTALIGRNGSGKSTLLKNLAGISFDYLGKVLIGDNNRKEIDNKNLARILSYVNTHRPSFANLKCIEIISLGRTPYTSWHGKLSTTDKETVERALEMVNMQDYAERYFHTLSDGESQKIMIARAIAQDTEIILLDEPTSFLDLPTRYEIISLLKNLTVDHEKTILFSTHELDIALELSDRIALITENKLYNESVRELIEKKLLYKLYNSKVPFLEKYLDFISKNIR